MRTAMKLPSQRRTRVFAPDLSGGMNRYVDSRVLPFGQGEAAFNVSVESGALTNGYGIAGTDVPSSYSKVFTYTVFDENTQTNLHYGIAYNRQNGKVYGGNADFSDLHEIDGVHFSSPPMGVAYKLNSEDVFLLCGQEGMAVIDADLQAVTVPSAPQITSLALHNERMFVTIGGRKNAVWFSDDLNPTNWNPELDEGGFIELEGERGRLNKVVAFGGYVYIFRDYGIARLTAYGDQSTFSVTNLFVSGGRIYGDTAQVCGDRILFLAEDGLYAFNGLTTSRIVAKLDGLYRAGNAPAACYSAGQYYIALQSTDAEKAAGNDLMLVIDPRTQNTTVCKDLFVTAFSPLKNSDGERLWVQTDMPFLGTVARGATYYGTSLRKVWRSGLSDMGVPDTTKAVTDVYLDTAHDCTVTVSTERGSKTLAFRGSSKVQHKRLHLVGSKVQMEIVAVGEICAARPALRFITLT